MRTRMRSCRRLSWGTTTLVISGCLGDPATNLNRTSALEAPPHIMFHGQGFTWKRSVPLLPPNLSIPKLPVAKTHDNGVAIDVNAEAAYQTYLSSLSDADYAEKMRVVVLQNGNEYLADSPPPLNEIAGIRSNLESHHGKSSVNSKNISITQSALAANGVEIVRSALSSDSRQPQDYTTYPGTTQIWLVTQCPPPDTADNCADYCSATLIGPNTALTAAHCFYDVPSQSWMGFIFGASGMDYQSNQYIARFTCYTLTLYSAFESDHNTTSPWDFAVMDFSGCSDNPAPAAGYLGYWQNISLDANSSVVWATGYPHDSLNCSVFQLCGMPGRAHGSGVYWVSQNIFTTQGQSGTSIYYDDPAHNYYSVGNLITGDISGSYNYFRRMDNTMYYLFHNYSDPVRFP